MLNHARRLERLCDTASFMAVLDKTWFDQGLQLGSLSGPLY